MRFRMRLIKSLQRNNAANVALMRSQFEAFSRQLPLLYFTLVANSLAVAFTHAQSAPAFLSKIVPALLCACCVLRLLVWARRRTRRSELTDSQIAVRMRNTVVLVVLLGGAFTAWGLSLYGYGGAYQRAHVASARSPIMRPMTPGASSMPV